jgi:hypothetical protein
MIMKVHRSFHIKYPLFVLDFNETNDFLNRLLKNPQISNFMEVHLVGAELFHVDGWTDRCDEARSRSSQFCEHT